MPNGRDEDLDLEALFASGEPVEDGILLPMPSMPIVREVEEDEVSVGAAIAGGQMTPKGTNEVAKVPPQLDALRLGDEITLPDGTKSKLQFVSPDRLSVGVGKRKGRNYTFFSMVQFVEMTGREVAEDWKKKREAEAREQGAPSPPPPKMPAKVFIPKGYKLYPHQVSGIEFIERQGRGLIADEMGLGKTVTAIAAIQTPAIIVCPSLLKVNWAREITRWHPESSIAIINGKKAEAGAAYFDPKEDIRIRKAAAAGKRPRLTRKVPTAAQVAQVQQNADIVVINYDILASHAEWLMQRQNRTLIADEAHYLKRLDIRWDKRERRHAVKKGSQRAAAFYEMQREIERLILLTGTPILNRVRELFPLLNMIDPREWSSGFKFCQRYCAGEYEWVDRRQTKRVFNCDGRSHSQELHDRINGVYMMRHTKEQELAEFPEKLVRTMDVSMPKQWREEYRRASQNFIDWVEENGGPEAVASAMMAEQLVQLGKLRAIAARGKVEAGLNWITRFFESNQRPLVVFALHEKVFDDLEAGIAKINERVRNRKKANQLPPISRELRVARITGKVSAAKRQAAIDAFQQEGTIDVLLYSIPIATGTTLTRASDALFLERMWRPADLNQAEDRLHRIGQQNKVFIWYMDAAGTIDAKLGQLLVRKSEAFSAVIDGVELDTASASALVFGEMFSEMGLAMTSEEQRALTAAMLEESAETMAYERPEKTQKNPGDDSAMLDPYVRAAVAGIPYEEYISERSLVPNVGAPEVFDEDDEYIDTFGEEFYGEEEAMEPNPSLEQAAADSWFDPL